MDAEKWHREYPVWPVSLALLVRWGITAGKTQRSLRTQQQWQYWNTDIVTFWPINMWISRTHRRVTCVCQVWWSSLCGFWDIARKTDEHRWKPYPRDCVNTGYIKTSRRQSISCYVPPAKPPIHRGGRNIVSHYQWWSIFICVTEVWGCSTWVRYSVHLNTS